MPKVVSIVSWMAFSAVVLFIITMPVSIQAHLVTAVMLLALMLVIKTFRLSGTWRLMLLAFGTTIVLRYAFWRTTSTLPPVSQIADFIPGFLLYMAEMYSVMMLGLSLFVVSSPLPPRPSQRLSANDRVPS